MGTEPKVPRPEPLDAVEADAKRVWTCQHGTERRGYATPTANCRECRMTDCIWTEQRREGTFGTIRPDGETSDVRVIRPDHQEGDA